MKTVFCFMVDSKKIVEDYIYRKDIKKAALARKIGTTPQNLWRYFQAESFTCEFIHRLSVALEHDFFEDLSAAFKREQHKEVSAKEIFLKEEAPAYGLEALLRKIVREEMAKQK